MIWNKSLSTTVELPDYNYCVKIDLCYQFVILGAKSQTSLLQNVLSGHEQGKTAVLS